MDIDLELDSDRIGEFLRGKLVEIESINAQLGETLQSRQETVLDLRKQISIHNNETGLIFGPVWKKTINSEYVLGFSVKNERRSTVENVSVLLDWSSSLPLNCKYYLITSDDANTLTDGLKSTSTLETYGHMIITLKIPSFTDHRSYSLNASVTFQQNQKQFSVKLPSSIQLSPEDVTDQSTIVHLYKVIQGSTVDLLALVFTQEKYEFIMVIPDNWSQLLENTLEVDCSFCRINVSSSTTFFLVHNLCPLLDGTLLTIDSKIHLSIYSKNQETTIALLHHLYRHCSDIEIVPLKSHRHEPNDKDVVDCLKSALFKEMDQLQENVKGCDLKELRMKMAPLENHTDDLVRVANEKFK